MEQNREQKVRPPHEPPPPPIIKQPPSTFTQNQPVIIEQTDKQWKHMMIAGTLLFILGSLTCFMPLCVVGALTWVVGKWCSWYHHG